jgi:acyl carrier protein
MTEDEFCAIVKKVNAQFDPSWLSQAVEDTVLDSLELMELRSALETRLGRAIPDSQWFDSKTLEDLLRGIN